MFLKERKKVVLTKIYKKNQKGKGINVQIKKLNLDVLKNKMAKCKLKVGQKKKNKKKVDPIKKWVKKETDITRFI